MSRSGAGCFAIDARRRRWSNELAGLSAVLFCAVTGLAQAEDAMPAVLPDPAHSANLRLLRHIPSVNCHGAMRS